MPADDARKAYAAVPGPEQLVWVETDSHCVIHDQPDLVTAAVDAAADWLTTHLGSASGRAEPTAGVR